MQTWNVRINEEWKKKRKYKVYLWDSVDIGKDAVSVDEEAVRGKDVEMSCALTKEV